MLRDRSLHRSLILRKGQRDPSFAHTDIVEVIARARRGIERQLSEDLTRWGNDKDGWVRCRAHEIHIAIYPDEVIAGILNRQDRKTATGERFTANQVGSLRRYRSIPRFQPSAEPPTGELVSIHKAAQILGMNTSSIHRWLADGFIAGEQVTPGAPWQIRITDELRARIVQQAPPEYLPMLEATIKLGFSRQTVLQRVKRGELDAVLVRQGRRKGLRIKVIGQQPALFEQLS